jgi:hypothetical protein
MQGYHLAACYFGEQCASGLAWLPAVATQMGIS